MGKSNPKTFRAILERMGTGPVWVAARVPGDLKKAWPEWRNRRVRGAINGFEFQTSLFPVKENGFMFVVNKKMQKGAAAGPGDTVQVRLEPDLTAQSYVEPKELTAVLRGERQLRIWFNAMTPSMRRGFAFLIDQAKTSETRMRRAEKIAETVMLAMEGEQVAPPILRAAFQRQPLAEQGWNAMTPIQRRRHLLGIFLPVSVDAQARRTAWVIKDCLRVAQKTALDE
ncbi:MAG TPA: YdeI/OmpD-associated family protein [Terracidiphilus sp.]|jgi:hypothetical protein|nr:YdeI/OmpD-associated family protein [Terracidiphilus sp.]